MAERDMVVWREKLTEVRGGTDERLVRTEDCQQSMVEHERTTKKHIVTGRTSCNQDTTSGTTIPTARCYRKPRFSTYDGGPGFRAARTATSMIRFRASDHALGSCLMFKDKCAVGCEAPTDVARSKRYERGMECGADVRAAGKGL